MAKREIMNSSVCYLVSDSDAETLEKVAKITGVSYNKPVDMIEVEALMEALHDMVVEYENLEEEYGDLQERYQDKYYGAPDPYDAYIDRKLTEE